MCRDCHEKIVEAAIGEGRIDFERRELYVRAFEKQPRETAEFLVDLPPNAARAQANRELADPEGVEAERRAVAVALGMKPEDVI